MFTIRPRRRWTRYKPNLTWVNWKRSTVDVFVHHTADSGPGTHASVAEEAAYMRRIEDFHIEQRDYTAIGYNYVIMPSGRVWEGRGFERQGAHTLDPKDADGDKRYVENDQPGICFAGNFEVQKPTRRALAAYKALKLRLRAKGVRIDREYPHSDAFPTACPGRYLREALGL